MAVALANEVLEGEIREGMTARVVFSTSTSKLDVTGSRKRRNVVREGFLDIDMNGYKIFVCRYNYCKIP